MQWYQPRRTLQKSPTTSEGWSAYRHHNKWRNKSLISNFSTMEKEGVVYDTISVMENYNFHQPIKTSIIYEDFETKLNQVIDPADMDTNLQVENQMFSYTMEQRELYSNNGLTHNTDISSYHRLCNSETEISKQRFNSCYNHLLSKNNSNTHPYMRNPHANSRRLNHNNDSTIKNSVLYNSPINETTLLNQVAENLAVIIEDYVHYDNSSYTPYSKQDIELLKAQCLFRKLYYFQKCLIFEELLIRHENDVRFVRNLTKKVVQIAKVKFPQKLISNLFKNLLDWIKRNKHQKMNTFQQIQKSNETSTAEPPLPSSNVCLENHNYNRLNTNIFSYGPPGTRIALSINPQALGQQRTNSNAYQSYTTKTNEPNKNLPNHTNANSSNPEITYISQTNYAFMNESNQHNNQPIYMYSNHGIHNNYNNINCNNMGVNHIDSQDATRSSISRDSGFMSPVTSISPSEPMYNNTQNSSLQDTWNFNFSNTTTMEKNIANEGLPVWNDIQNYP